MPLNQTRFVDENNLSDDEFKCFFSMLKEQFEELFTYCDRVPCQDGYKYISKKNLLTFLFQMRQGLSDDFLKVMF